MSVSDEILMYKRIRISIEISTMTSEEKADEIFCRYDVEFPNKSYTFLDVSMALFELEKAKEYLMKAGTVLESRLKR